MSFSNGNRVCDICGVCYPMVDHTSIWNWKCLGIKGDLFHVCEKCRKNTKRGRDVDKQKEETILLG